MLAASHLLLGMLVFLLAVALLAANREVGVLRQKLGLARTGATAIIPLISVSTLAGDMLTIGGASRDGRASLLLFLRTECVASAQALRFASTLCKPARLRLRLIVFGEGERAAYCELTRAYNICEADIVLHEGIGEEIGVDHWPAAVLTTGDGALLGKSGVQKCDQLEALLALLPAPRVLPDESIRSIA